MAAVYDNWERLVRATLRREDLRRSGLRTPSDLSSSPSFSESSSSKTSDSLGAPFTYDQILQATNNLRRSNLVFFGLSGVFFYGVLEGGDEVVVKKVDSSSAHEMSLLKSEMEFFARVSHPNFVPLLGYCLENQDYKFLVYKYMPNKDLFTAFCKKNDGIDGPLTPLDWKSRLRVATGVAQALCHLHHECVPPLVHSNVAAGCILIDEKYDGHLGRLTGVCTEKKDRKQSRISKLLRLPKGSEQGASGASKPICSYDVYCFGKVLLELVIGIPVPSYGNNSMENILPYITPYDKEIFLTIIDPYLTFDKDEHLLNEIFGVAVLAKVCLSPNPSERPLMKNVLEMLTSIGSPSSGQFTQAVPLPAQAESKVPKGSQLGMAEATTDAFSAGRWTALWRSGAIWDIPNLRVFSFAQLKSATQNFRSDGVLGESAFGRLYKGYLPEKSASSSDRQSLIAVKRLNPDSMEGFEEWQTEIKMLGRLSHPNLIKLCGYCSEDKELLLVYEYMPKGSLDNHLFGRGSTRQPLSLYTRLKVLIGAARGLAYLHAFRRAVIFRDLQTSSILLDSSYNAKLTGFGLARDGPPEHYTHVTTRVLGTYGYAAPEYIATGHLYVKSDVYGFGVVMVEVLTGLKAVDASRSREKRNLIDWMKPRLSEEQKIKSTMDSRLEGKYPVQAAVRMAQLALTCLASIPKDRPSMIQVVEALQRISVESFQESEKN